MGIIYSYESEHFLVSQNCESRKNGERVHNVFLLKVKRDDNGEKLTALGTGVYKDVCIPDNDPTYMEDKEGNRKAHKKAENAAYQLAFNLMSEVDAGKYDHKRFDAE